MLTEAENVGKSFCRSRIKWKGCSYGMVNGTSVEFQLSKLFAHPNIETSGNGQKGSNNQGWTVIPFVYFIRNITSGI